MGIRRREVFFDFEKNGANTGLVAVFFQHFKAGFGPVCSRFQAGFVGVG